MGRVFYNKKFSDYLGENRAIMDIVESFVPDGTPAPSPTPSITPSNTPTPTPSITPSNTPSVTPTNTPSTTPSNTPSITPTNTPSTTPSNTPSVTPSITPSVTPSITPTITPTPSDPRTCRTYEIANTGFGSTIFDWTNCDGSLSSTTLSLGASLTICAKNGSVSYNINGTITDIGTCPLPSPTPTNTNTPTPSITPSSSPGPTYDTDAKAYLEAVVSAGGTVSPVVSGATDTMFKQLKSNNLYSKLDVFYPMIGGTSASTAIMGKRTSGTTYDIEWSNPSLTTFNYSGVTGNGSSTFGDTKFNGFNLISSTPGASSHFGLYVGTNESGSYSEIGTRTNGNWIMAVRFSNNFFYGWNYTPGGNELVFPTTDATGMYVETRNAVNSAKAFRNGNLQVTVTNTETNTIPNSNVRILSDGTLYSARRIQFVSIGKGLDDTESITLSTIINTFQTSLGRNTY